MANYNRFIERMRESKQFPVSGVERSQSTQELLETCHVENRGNKVVLSDTTGQVIRVVPLPV